MDPEWALVLQLLQVRLCLMFYDVYYVKLKIERSQQLCEPGSHPAKER
jgi:hypothetical protein